MKIIFSGMLLLLFGLTRAQPYAASNFTLISRIDPETGTNANGDKYAGCWGWTDNTGKEYAIACSQSGTYWVNISSPASPVVCDYEPGSNTGATWRETKTYLNYCYVVSDDTGSNAFQIFDMQYLPDSVHLVHQSDSILSRGHTLWVDGDKLYVASVTQSNSVYQSMNIYSLADPEKPGLIASLFDDHPFISVVHDMYVRNDTVFASCAWQGLYVFKLNTDSTFTQIGSLSSYPSSGYNHSSALTPDGKTLVFMDEVPDGLPIKFADVSNLQNIQIKGTHKQFQNTTPHNPFMVSNRYCFTSSYQDGLQLYDLADPANPFIVGYFDTYPQGGNSANNYGPVAYKGQWGAYPYFPSKTILCLDMFNGIFLLKTHLYANPVSTVSVDEQSLTSTLELYPNPAQSAFFFSVPSLFQDQNLTLTVLDVYGRKLIEHQQPKGTTTGKVDVSGLNEGMYTAVLSAGSKNTLKNKLIITR